MTFREGWDLARLSGCRRQFVNRSMGSIPGQLVLGNRSIYGSRFKEIIWLDVPIKFF